MKNLFPFNTLQDKIQYMRKNPAEISTMLSFAGNRRVTEMTNEVVQKIFNKEPRESVVNHLKQSWKVIEKRHPEINTDDVIESVFWHLDGACQWVNYEEISVKEIEN